MPTNFVNAVEPTYTRLYYARTKTLFFGYTGYDTDFFGSNATWMIGYYIDGDQIHGTFTVRGINHGPFIIRRELTMPTGTISLVKLDQSGTTFERILLMDGFGKKRKRIETKEISELKNRSNVSISSEHALNGYPCVIYRRHDIQQASICSYTYRG